MNKGTSFLVKLLAAGVVAYGVGFFLFIAGLPKKPPGPLTGDAIVALTGGEARLDAAVALFEGGAGQRLLISGVNTNTTKAELKKLNHGGARFDCCADLGRQALDTHGNAIEAARWALAHHYKSLILVTASYHMPRSLTEFSGAMPDVKVMPYPVEPADVDLAAWWKPGTLRLLHGEYARYLASLVTTAFETPQTPPADSKICGVYPLMLFFRSALFFIWFAVTTLALTLLYLPLLLLPRGAIVSASKFWSRVTLLGLKIFAGLGYEVRGEIPKGGVLVAAKHMSIWDTLILYLLLDDAVVILKRELFTIPFYGWYVKKSGMIGIDREGGASSLRKMNAAAKEALTAGRPLLIFPEGTRKKPGDAPDYKPGVAGMYSMLDVPTIPAALNSGAYWTGFIKKPGTIVLEFLPAIPPGLRRAEFMQELQSRIETATDRLLSKQHP